MNTFWYITLSTPRLTRAVTYTLFFCLGYGLFLGPIFGLVAGVGLGLALGFEFGRIDRHHTHTSPTINWRPLLFGLFRGLSFEIAAMLAFGWLFGATFGILSGLGLVGVYLLGFSPTHEYQAGSKPSFRPRAFIASAVRGLSTGTSGAIAGIVAERGIGTLLFGLEVGLVSAVVSIFSPFIEWWADNLPARRLGIFGAVLLLLGLLVQSISYWVTVFNVPVQ